MQDKIFWLMVYCGLPAIGYMLAQYMKKHNDRFDSIEKQVDHAVTKFDVREMLADKIDPIKEDLTELKGSIKSLTETVWELSNRINSHD